jgi:acyl dehydratase
VNEFARVGSAIPPLKLAAITRADLAAYAQASGDDAAVHLDDQYARAMGFPGVIAHGLLVMAYLARVLTNWQPVGALRNFSCRFMTVTLPGEELECRGVIAALRETEGESLADLDLEVRNQGAELKLAGKATVVLKSRSDAWSR